MSHDEIELSHVNDCDRAPPFDVAEFYERKAAWSREVFGPQQRVEGVIAHLRKELAELRAAIADPDRQIGDVSAIREELADICLLAIDLSWRAGGSSDSFHGGTSRIALLDAADYIGRHLDSSMPPAALAAVVWDIAFRALGCDGSAIETKFSALLTRTWPDWRTVPADQPIEHVRDLFFNQPLSPMLNLDAERLRCIDLLAKVSPKDRETVEYRIAAIDRMQKDLNNEKAWKARIEHVREPVCAHCNDSHRMPLGERDVPCTWCPCPCDSCRVGGYCRSTPCGCECHTILVDAAASAPAAVDANEETTVQAVQRCAARVAELEAQLEKERDRSREYEQMALAAGRTHRGQIDAIAEVLSPGIGPDVSASLIVDGVGRMAAERDRLRFERNALISEQVEWRADSERLRLERDDARKALAAQPNETLTMAAQRVVGERKECSDDSVRLRLENGSAHTAGRLLAAAFGMDGARPLFSALIERAGQLHDDSVAYRSLRGRLVDMLGCSGDFTEKDIADLIADRINGPFTESEDDLLEQVRRLEGDVGALKAALHVATRGQS